MIRTRLYSIASVCRFVAAFTLLLSCSAGLAAELPEGFVISKDNIDKVKNDTFDGHTVASLLTEKLEWQIRNWNLTMPMEKAKPFVIDPHWKEATDKYSGEVKFDPATRNVTGFKAGLPFPNLAESDPYLADKLMWNYYYGYPEGNQAENLANLHLVNADKGLESYQELTYNRVHMTGRLISGPPVLGDGTIRHKTLFLFNEPQDVRGIGSFAIRYDVVGKHEDAWAYVKSVRRVRRLSGGVWMDPIGGTDFLNEDSLVFNARPNWYKSFKVLGKRWMLVSSNAPEQSKLRDLSKKGTPEEWPTADLRNAPHWNPINVPYQPREVWIIEGIPPPEHPYGKKIIYMEITFPILYEAEIYDKKGDYWKHTISHWRPITTENGLQTMRSVKGETIDFKAKHATLFHTPYARTDRPDRAPDDVSLTKLEAGRR